MYYRIIMKNLQSDRHMNLPWVVFSSLERHQKVTKWSQKLSKFMFIVISILYYRKHHQNHTLLLNTSVQQTSLPRKHWRNCFCIGMFCATDWRKTNYYKNQIETILFRFETKAPLETNDNSNQLGEGSYESWTGPAKSAPHWGLVWARIHRILDLFGR